MDKFGIFKLLNSFFNYYEQNKGSSNDNFNSKQNSSQTLLNDLLSSFTNKSQPTINKVEQSKKVEKVYAPLQSSMLSTMNSHDEFIKRVKEKNNAPQK